jgi:hypothetical protein
MTAVIRRAEAVRQAFIMMSSSMRWSLIGSDPVWMMKTSSSRTDSPLRQPRWHSGEHAYGDCSFTVGCFENDDLGTFEAQSGEV